MIRAWSQPEAVRATRCAFQPRFDENALSRARTDPRVSSICEAPQGFALVPCRCSKQVGGTHRGQHPVHRCSNSIVHEKGRERGPHAARLADLHMIAGRHHEIGRPRYFATESIEDRGGCFGDPIVAIWLAVRWD